MKSKNYKKLIDFDIPISTVKVSATKPTVLLQSITLKNTRKL